MSDIKFDQKTRRILSLLVREYIKHGQPIGSKSISMHSQIRFAASTVRKILHFLEKSGFLTQKHRSGGRIPTDLAYRFYVDEYVKDKFKNRYGRYFDLIPSLILTSGTPEDIYLQITNWLSDKAKQLALIFRMDKSGEPLLRLNIILRESKTLMFVTTYADGESSSHVLKIDFRPTKKRVTEAERFLNQRLEGLTPMEIKEQIEGRCKQPPKNSEKIVFMSVTHKEEIFSNHSKALLMFGGTHYLVSHIDIFKTEKLAALMSFVEEKEAFEELLSSRLTNNFQVTIGSENKQPMLKDCSIVTYPINSQKHRAVIGILGPTRMPYIKILELLAEAGAMDCFQ